MEQLFLNILQNESPFTWLYHFFMMALVSMIPFTPIPVLAAFIASHYDSQQGYSLICSVQQRDPFFCFFLVKSFYGV